MRGEHEWLSYLASLDEDRRQRVITGKSKMIPPRDEIMIQTPERRNTYKADVYDEAPLQVPMSCIEGILRYRPVEVARDMTTPLMLIGVETDAITPIDHARAIYNIVPGPRRLVTQRHTTHYAANEQYGDRLIPMITDWFDRYLRDSGDLVIDEILAV